MPRKPYIIFVLLTVLPMFAIGGEQSIVPYDVCDTPEYRLAAEFLNHYNALLHTTSTEAVADSLRRTKSDGFRYIIGNDAALKNLKGGEDFTLKFSEGQYTAKWSEKGETKIACGFPANIGLLTFSNKITLEQKMLTKLEADSRWEAILPKCLKNELRKIGYSDLYVSDQGFYITPRLKHQIVYQPSASGSDTCTMLLDNEKYPLETLANTMLSGYSPYEHEVTVRLNRYGYTESVISLPFTSLFNILESEGCTPYWGVDQYDGDMVDGVYLWINPYGGYAHLLSIHLPIAFNRQSSEIEAKMHCYIRLDNIKSLFEEYPEL